MIGLDTNILVRYIVQDDPAQAKAAGALIESHCTAEAPCRVDSIAFCELTWVLESCYGYPRETVARVLNQLLETAELSVEAADLAWAAVRAYEAGTADVADCLMGSRNRAVGCKSTYTFDRRAARTPWHTLVEGE